MAPCKFRAWVKLSPSWSKVAGNGYKMIQVKGMDFGSNWMMNDSTHARYSIVGNVLMQYTGIDDCEGKRIYEGDIISCLDVQSNSERVGHVTFRNGYFCLVDENERFIDLLNRLEVPVVVGDIYSARQTQESIQVDDIQNDVETVDQG